MLYFFYHPQWLVHFPPKSSWSSHPTPQQWRIPMPWSDGLQSCRRVLLFGSCLRTGETLAKPVGNGGPRWSPKNGGGGVQRYFTPLFRNFSSINDPSQHILHDSNIHVIIMTSHDCHFISFYHILMFFSFFPVYFLLAELDGLCCCHTPRWAQGMRCESPVCGASVWMVASFTSHKYHFSPYPSINTASRSQNPGCQPWSWRHLMMSCGKRVDFLRPCHLGNASIFEPWLECFFLGAFVFDLSQQHEYDFVAVFSFDFIVNLHPDGKISNLTGTFFVETSEVLIGRFMGQRMHPYCLAEKVWRSEKHSYKDPGRTGSCSTCCTSYVFTTINCLLWDPTNRIRKFRCCSQKPNNIKNMIVNDNDITWHDLSHETSLGTNIQFFQKWGDMLSNSWNAQS